MIPAGALSTSVARALRRRGFAELPLPDDESLLEVATRLGTLVSARAGQPVLSRLTPTPREGAASQSLSAAHGLGHFPFHTDGAHHVIPPRLILMRCDDINTEGVPTVLADSATVHLDKRQIKLIERAVWRVNQGPRGFLAAIYSRGRSRLNVRFDRGCMVPAHDEAQHAGKVFEAALAESETFDVCWTPGLGVIIDNGRVLHGRPAIDDRSVAGRVLKRVLVR